MRGLRLAAPLALALAAGVGAERASACSCFPADPRRALMRSDGAFVGVLLSKRILAGGSEAVFTFRLERAYKGRFGPRPKVYSASNGAACGLEGARGQRIGLFLSRDHGRWVSSLCSQIAPAALQKAAQPLPRPNGRGPATLLAGGSFGEARLLALDSAGRTLAYGKGTGTTLSTFVCPGAKRVVESVSTPGARNRLAVRTLPTLSLVRQQTAPGAGRTAFLPLACTDADAAMIRGVTRTAEGEPSAIAEVRRSGLSRLYVGPMSAAAIRGDRAFVVEGDELLVVDLFSGLKSRIAHVPPRVAQLTPSPDGRFVAALQPPDFESDDDLSAAAVLVDVAAGTVRSASIGEAAGATVAWLDAGRVAYLPSYTIGSSVGIFDTSLRRLGGFAPWETEVAAVVGDSAWGVAFGSLTRATLPSGPQRVVRTLESPEVLSLAAVAEPPSADDASGRALATCPAA